jgi:hypothetical protein
MSFNDRSGQFEDEKSVTSAYQVAAELNILTFEYWEHYYNYLHSNPNTAAHRLSLIHVCEQELYLSRYFDLPPKVY